MSEQTRRQSDLGWVARWVGLVATLLVVAMIAISCQERKVAEAQVAAAQVEGEPAAEPMEGESAPAAGLCG